MNEAADFWTRHVFVLVTPDAVLRGVHTGLVRRLAAQRFLPVASRLAVSNSDMIDELYAEVIAGQWQTWHYRMLDDAFALGPCLALICRYDGDAGDPHDLMRALKGSSTPHRTSRGELRFDFGALNGILGVMHASDNSGESAKDAAIFGLTPAAAAGATADAADKVAVLCALTQPACPERRDFDAVLGGLRASFVTALWDQFGDDAAVAELSILLKDSCSDALASPAGGARLLDLCRHRLPADVVDVLACEFTPATRAGRRPADLFETIRRHGLRIDPWQRVVLESSLHFDPVRRPW
ncbi:MAG TPA: nucleoside-diphosphate kinase [Streptosporangiaceae bacterium]|nr:nucleoside-diphosphate kinase [Streptosporangiaceae bacterium]